MVARSTLQPEMVSYEAIVRVGDSLYEAETSWTSLIARDCRSPHGDIFGLLIRRYTPCRREEQERIAMQFDSRAAPFQFNWPNSHASCEGSEH